MFYKNIRKIPNINYYSKRITCINHNIKKLKPTRYIFHIIWDENYKYCKYKLVNYY